MPQRRGRKKGRGGGGGQGGRGNQLKEQPLLAQDEWDDQDNPYLTLFRKKLRKTMKKIQKQMALKEKDPTELNDDQKKSLQLYAETRIAFNTMVQMSNECKALAREEIEKVKPQEEPVEEEEEEVEEEPVEEPVEDVEEKKSEVPAGGPEAQEVAKPAPPPPEVSLSEREKLLALFHVSNSYQHTWDSQKPLLAELHQIGIQSSHEELNGLKTISHFLQGQLQDERMSPNDKFDKACNVSQSYLTKSTEILEVAGISFERLRTVAEGVLRTPTWRSKIIDTYADFQVI